MKMVAIADDFSAAGKLKSLLQWWTTLLKVEPKFGYFPEPAKSWLITKPETHALFKYVKVKIKKFRQRVPKVSYRYIYFQETVR